MAVNLSFRPQARQLYPKYKMTDLDVEELLESAAAAAKEAKEQKAKLSTNTPTSDDAKVKQESDDRRHRGRDRDSSRERKHRDRSRRRGSDDVRSDRSDRSRRNRSRSPDRRPRDGDYYRGGGRYRRSRTPDDGDRYRPGSRRDRRDRSRSNDRYNRNHRDRDRDRERDSRRHDHSPKNKSPKTPPSNDDDRDRRTIFVQQLAAHLRTKDLKEFFTNGAGEVREATIVKDRVSHRSKGMGYVEFVSEESVAKALKMTGQKLMGIPIIASTTEAEKNRAARAATNANNNSVPFHRLYVGNVHFSITDDDIKDVFSSYGEVESAELAKDEQGRSRGYGFVQYVDPANAKLALEGVNGLELVGRPLRVGLGNDKNIPGSAQAMLNRMGGPAGQGSGIFGAGGRGHHAGGSTNFDRAGGRDEKGAGGASALDDTDVSGVNFSNYSREKLMRQLAREPDPVATPAANGTGKRPVNTPSAIRQPAGRHIKISNAFDPDVENQNSPDGSWIKELEGDIKDECEAKYGPISHIAIQPNNREGEVYIRFDKVESGERALQGLNGRFFGGRVLTAAPVNDGLYSVLFGRPRALA